MTFHAIKTKPNGLGLCVGGYDEYDNACTDFTPITDSPTNTANAINYLYTPTPTGAPTSGNASSGFNWGLLAPLFGAAGAIGSGYAASELKPGQSMQTAGTTIVGAGQSLPGSTISGGLNLSGLMLPLLIGGGGLLVLAMVMKGK